MTKIFSHFPEGIHNVLSDTSISLLELYALIKEDNRIKELTNKLRSLPDKAQKNEFKKGLPSFTPGGVFIYRSETRLRQASNIVCIDIDNWNNTEELKQLLISNLDQLILLFTSPSGNGLKLLFRCNQKFTYKENYKAITEYLHKKFNVDWKVFDQSCANVAKACFLCHDSEIYINPLITNNGVVDDIPYWGDFIFPSSGPNSQGQTNSLNDQKLSFESNEFENPVYIYQQLIFDFNKPNSIENFKQLCRLNIQKNGHLVAGKRHLWFLSLATYCNRFGISIEHSLNYSTKFFANHPAVLEKENLFEFEKEVSRSFKDVYTNLKSDFNSWENYREEYESPLIPSEAYDKLPCKIKSIVNLFQNRERDVFFIGLLTLFSTLFPRVHGRYFHRIYRMNIFSFISAPQASGKGVLSWVRVCGSEIHEAFLEEYKKELSKYNELTDEDKKEVLPPTMKKLFLSADITGPMIIKNIDANKLFGIVMDTEADTMTNANKAEHGNFSSIFRKCFEHEAIEYERKTSKEYYYIQSTALSILISGTPKQVNRLMYDVENGLISRFIFYSYTAKSEWKNVFEEGDNYEHIFKSVAKELSFLIKPYLNDFIQNPEKEILFDLTENQKSLLNEWFSEKLQALTHIYGNDIDGNIKRLGVINFRLAMILTMVRKIYSNNPAIDKNDAIYCSDEDFEISKRIIDTLLYHTISIFTHLRSRGVAKNFKQVKQMYMDTLPDSFDWKKAKEVAGFLSINVKTAENYLRKAISEGFLIKCGHNDYQKRNE